MASRKRPASRRPALSVMETIEPCAGICRMIADRNVMPDCRDAAIEASATLNPTPGSARRERKLLLNRARRRSSGMGRSGLHHANPSANASNRTLTTALISAPPDAPTTALTAATVHKRRATAHAYGRIPPLHPSRSTRPAVRPPTLPRSARACRFRRCSVANRCAAT